MPSISGYCVAQVDYLTWLVCPRLTPCRIAKVRYGVGTVTRVTNRQRITCLGHVFAHESVIVMALTTGMELTSKEINKHPTNSPIQSLSG